VILDYISKRLLWRKFYSC